MRIKKIENPSFWDEVVETFGAGPYLYWAWKTAIEKVYRHQGIYLIAQKGDEPLGLLPLVKFKTPFKTSWVSLPFCDYGGIWSKDKESFLHLFSEAQRLAQGKPLEIRFSQKPPYIKGPEGAGKVRLLLELPGNSEKLWKQLKSKVRSQVRRPQKDGAKALVGGLELLPAFYKIYQENMHYLGSPAHSIQWFKVLLSSFGERARVVLVHLKQTPLAAAILLFARDTATVPWASSLRAYKKISPNMLLYWTMLALAADQGLKYFDFGRSSPGSGTYRFKKQWGAYETPLYWYGRSPSGKISKKREILAKGWQKTPKPLANWLGPFLRRYISL